MLLFIIFFPAAVMESDNLQKGSPRAPYARAARRQLGGTYHFRMNYGVFTMLGSRVTFLAPQSGWTIHRYNYKDILGRAAVYSRIAVFSIRLIKKDIESCSPRDDCSVYSKIAAFTRRLQCFQPPG